MILEAALLGSFGAVDLRWESAAGCPDATAVGRDLDTLLHEDARAPRAEVTGRVAAERGAYVLHLEVALAGRREARELRASDCAVLARAGVLVAAVTLDALATAAAVDALAVSAPERPVNLPPTSTVPEPLPRARPGSVAEPPDSNAEVPESPTTRPPQSGTLAASAGLSQGMTPGLAGGIEGQLGWRRGALRLFVGGFHWFSRSTELEPEVGIEAALSGGSLRGCAAFERARLEVPVCAGIDLAAMHGGGSGRAVRPRPVIDLWVGVAAGAGLVYWATRRFALQARVEGVLGARRPAMYLVIDDEPHEAFRMPPVGLRLLAGPLVRLW